MDFRKVVAGEYVLSCQYVDLTIVSTSVNVYRSAR